MGNNNCRYAIAASCIIPTPFDDALLHHEERERERGQAILRSMVTSSDSVDWDAVIAKAQELHAREQMLIRRRKRKEQLKIRKQIRKDLARRRKEDAVGSFSVNMLTYRSDGSCSGPDGHKSPRVLGGGGDVGAASSTLTGSTKDDLSHSSFPPTMYLTEFVVFTRSWEDGMTPPGDDGRGMTPIDEGREQSDIEVDMPSDERRSS